jgi:TPR repeat protein
MEGCVYIISNKSLPTLKIGRTTKTAIKRAKQFDNAAIPHRFVAEYELRVKYHHEQFEEKVHRLLASKWYGGECFKCDIEYAVQIIKEAAKEFTVIGEVFYWVEIAKKEALLGIPEAQAELGYAYYKGYGVEQDYNLAKEWFKKSAGQGNSKAQNYLGLIYYKQGININKREYNNKNLLDICAESINDLYIRMAKYWLEKSAEQHNSDAEFNLGIIYYEASKLEKNCKKAFQLFEKSALQGNSDAQFYLAKMYQYGDWGKPDIEKSKYWYLKAIESDENILAKVIKTCLRKKLF